MKKEKVDLRWRVISVVFVLCIVFLLIAFYNIYQEVKETKRFNSLEGMCERIKITPSWMNSRGTLVGEGFQIFGGNMTGIVDMLIDEPVYFLYSSSCPACLNQITLFGDDWKKYEESNLTIDCLKLK